MCWEQASVTATTDMAACILFACSVGLLGLQESEQAAQRSVLVENDAKYVARS